MKAATSPDRVEPSKTAPVDLTLVARAVARGDGAAFRTLVEHTEAPMYRLAARLTGRLADAEDALQDAYVSAYRALEEGRWDGRAKIETWLYRIVTNASIDLLRRRKDARESLAVTAHEPSFDGDVTAEARIALAELEAMLGDLPPLERAALVLVSVEGLSAKEAATVLDCSEGAIEQRLVRARTALRTKRGDHAA